MLLPLLPLVRVVLDMWCWCVAWEVGIMVAAEPLTFPANKSISYYMQFI
jgi:hypothetical protein